MKIATFFSDTPFASWGLTYGWGNVLRRMGHEVIEIGFPATYEMPRSMYEKLKAKLPTFETLQSCDVYLTSGPEYHNKFIQHFYPEWGKLKGAKLGYFIESSDRPDVSLDYPSHLAANEFNFFPSEQDAEKFKCPWVPFGVDTDIFHPAANKEKKYDVAFIGMMYPLRHRFLAELKPLLGDIELTIGEVRVTDLGGYCHRQWADLYAENIRQSKIFLALPSNNAMHVGKPFEVMGCGTAFVTNEIKGNKLFEYSMEYLHPKGAADLIRNLLADERDLNHMAEAQHAEVYAKHKIEDRLQVMFDAAGIGGTR